MISKKVRNFSDDLPKGSTVDSLNENEGNISYWERSSNTCLFYFLYISKKSFIRSISTNFCICGSSQNANYSHIIAFYIGNS